jgi:hypothetical protein
MIDCLSGCESKNYFVAPKVGRNARIDTTLAGFAPTNWYRQIYGGKGRHPLKARNCLAELDRTNTTRNIRNITALCL